MIIPIKFTFTYFRAGKAIQLEEKITRLEQERTELLITIEKGEGFDAAIQQIQQDNVILIETLSNDITIKGLVCLLWQARLQEELAVSNKTISAMECQQKAKADEWISAEIQLKEEKVKLQEQLSNLLNELTGTHEKQTDLQTSLEKVNKEMHDWQTKCHQLKSQILEIEEHNMVEVSTAITSF